MAKLMISTFLKNKNMIKAADVMKGGTSVVSQQRAQIMDNVEKLLLKFIKKKRKSW